MRNLIQIPGTRDAPRARHHAQIRDFLERTATLEPEAVAAIAGVSATIRARMQRYLEELPEADPVRRTRNPLAAR